MKKPVEAALGKGRLRASLEFASYIAAIISVILAIFFFYQSEHNKELNIIYAPKRPLVSVEPLKTNPKLEVSIAGARVNMPWLVSARLENSGDQPVESKDVEAFPTLQFRDAKIVSAEIINKSDAGVFARMAISGDTVSIEHKLLNPGDWISFDVLFDGEPNLPPQLSMRVTGVSKPKQTVISAGGKETHLALFEIPKPLFLIFLIFSTLIPVFLLGFGGYLGFAGVMQFIAQGRRTPAESEDDREKFIKAGLEKVQPITSTAKILCSGISRPFSLAELDDQPALANLLKQTVVSEVMDALRLNPNEAAMIVSVDLKNSLKMQFAERVWGWLKKGNEERKIKILAIDAAKTSAEDLSQSAFSLYLESVDPVRKVSEVDYDYLFNAGILLWLCAAITLILGGAWRNFLSTSFRESSF